MGTRKIAVITGGSKDLGRSIGCQLGATRGLFDFYVQNQSRRNRRCRVDPSGDVRADTLRGDGLVGADLTPQLDYVSDADEVFAPSRSG